MSLTRSQGLPWRSRGPSSWSSPPCAHTHRAPGCPPPPPIPASLLSPGNQSLLCPDLYGQRPVMVWLGRNDCPSLFSPSLEPEGLWLLSTVPMLSKIRPDLATSALGLTPLASTSQSRAVPSHGYLQSPEQPGSPPLPKCRDFLAHSLPRWLQRRSRQGCTTSMKRTAEPAMQTASKGLQIKEPRGASETI